MNDLLTMFDPQPGIAAHRAHAAGHRYTLPDYPAPGGVPIRAEGAACAEPESWPQPQQPVRRERTALSPALADAMAAARRLPARFTVAQLAMAQYGELTWSTRNRAWMSVRELLGRERFRRAGSVPRDQAPNPQKLFEIVPDEHDYRPDEVGAAEVRAYLDTAKPGAA